VATLIIETGSGSDLEFEIRKESISIGASAGNDVVLRVPGVAPQHLVIRRSGNRFTFLGQQRQVVLVNGKRRARGVIEEGDKIRIGTATLHVRESREEEVPPDESAGVADDEPAAGGASHAESREAPRQRAEVVLFNEPARLAAARRQLLEIFRGGARTDVAEALEGFFETSYPGRRSMIAWLDQQGLLQPIVSRWSGSVPQLPERTFAELDRGDRVAVLRSSGPDLLIYPVPAGTADSRVYALAETSEDDLESDRILLAELVSMLASNWAEFASSSALLGKWETEARAKVENRMPGTSLAIRTLRDLIVAAARSAEPVLLYGRPGSGRAYLGSLIASLRPTGRPWIRVVQVRKSDDSAVASELFGSASAPGARGLAEHAGGGVVVVRSVDKMSAELQRETAAAIGDDVGSGYGSSVRWILTAGENCLAEASESNLDPALLELVQRHLIRVPLLEERREDLPLLIVRMLEAAGAEQGKEIRGIELDTLDSLLTHSFTGQVAELLGELRRLVSATPDGEMVRGRVRGSGAPAIGPTGEGAEGALASETVAVLNEDDLKVVIPAVERLLIERVLRRAKGNQSRAARELNLSRGALISKIKEYDIPDYRSLRRAKS
jgi:DNA-binding NtrC family response regulator/pSer/pThr/pTyr-binding forkhead associated (FHA) protein